MEEVTYKWLDASDKVHWSSTVHVVVIHLEGLVGQGYHSLKPPYKNTESKIRIIGIGKWLTLYLKTHTIFSEFHTY